MKAAWITSLIVRLSLKSKLTILPSPAARASPLLDVVQVKLAPNEDPDAVRAHLYTGGPNTAPPAGWTDAYTSTNQRTESSQYIYTISTSDSLKHFHLCYFLYI